MMASNENQQPNIDRARELLSPYLDGEVSAEEQVLVEAALAASGELQADLESLRQAVHKHLSRCPDCREEYLEWLRELEAG